MRTVLVLLTLLPAFCAAQCYPDRHNTSWNEAWISCETRENPNAERGTGHWVLYDFGHTYRLGNTKMWNINSPDFLESGFKDFYIDYSQDGKKWKTLGQFNLPMAPGESTYEGVDVTSFGGDTARFVLLSAIDTHGGACAGIAEAKMEVIEIVSKLQSYDEEECFEVSIYPNPHREVFTFSVYNKCGGTIDYALFDHTGKRLSSGRFSNDESLLLKELNTGDLPAGLYHLILYNDNSRARYPVMKI
jgi:hypothetical protein